MLISIAFAMTAQAQTELRLSIDEMFRMIDQRNSSIKADRTAVEAAGEGVKAAKSQRLPDISTQLNFSYIGNALLTDRDFGNGVGCKTPHFGNQFLLDVQQTIYAGGAIDAGVRLAELGAEQAQLQLALSEQNQRFIALAQYLDLEKVAHREEVLSKNIVLTERLIANIREKQQQGVALKNDITRYELQLETQKLSLTKLQNTRRILNHQLCNTLGLADVTIVPDMNLEAIDDNLDSEQLLQTEAANLSPVLQQSAIDVKMAEQQLKLSKSELLPKIAVVAADNFAGPFTYDLPPIDKNFNIWYIGVGVKYSLSSLFKSNKSVRRAKEQLRLSNTAHSVAAETVNNNMQQAYTMHKQSFVELRTQQKSVELAQQNYQVVSNRYNNQLALITDMIDASNIKLNAELQEVNARINIAYTYYNVRYAAGNI